MSGKGKEWKRRTERDRGCAREGKRKGKGCEGREGNGRGEEAKGAEKAKPSQVKILAMAPCVVLLNFSIYIFVFILYGSATADPSCSPSSCFWGEPL